MLPLMDSGQAGMPVSSQRQYIAGQTGCLAHGAQHGVSGRRDWRIRLKRAEETAVGAGKQQSVGWCGFRGYPLLPGAPTPLSRGGASERRGQLPHRRLLRARVRVQVAGRGLQIGVAE